MARTIAVTTLAWDETDATFPLAIDKDITNQQSRSSYHVMVSAARVHLASVPHDTDKPIVSSYQRIARSPVAMPNTGAAALWHGLLHTPVSLF